MVVELTWLWQALAENKDVSDAKKQEIQQHASEMDVGAVQEAAKETEKELAKKKGGGKKLKMDVDWPSLGHSWKSHSWRMPHSGSHPEHDHQNQPGTSPSSMQSPLPEGSSSAHHAHHMPHMPGRKPRKQTSADGVAMATAHDLMAAELSKSKHGGKDVDVGKVKKEALKAAMMRSAEAGEALDGEQMSHLRMEVEEGIGQVMMLLYE